MELNHRIEDWLSNRVGKKARENYLFCWNNFTTFCKQRGKDPLRLVDDYRDLKYQRDREKEERFLDEYQDLIRAFSTWIKAKYAPRTHHNHLAVVKSFLKEWNIPINVKLLRRAPVIYHNRDFSKEQLRMILSKASQRDRAIFLMMAESGLRANTVVNLKYWLISEDFEKETVPMKILTPASTIKDNVGDRWSFIGEDGVRALRDYLKVRMPLKAQDYVFQTKKPSRVKGEQFTEASISTIFRRITLDLKMEKGTPFGKPGHYRMHGLRKYFFNNMRAPKEYRDFWMGHRISGSDEHYLTRDAEEHRRRYEQGYPSLRIFEPIVSEELVKEQQSRIEQLERDLREQRELLYRMATLKAKAMSQKDVDELDRLLDRLAKKIYPEHETAEERIKEFEKAKKEKA